MESLRFLGSSLGLLLVLTALALTVVTLAGAWRMFEKAGRPGWGVLVPFYNMYLIVQMVGMPSWTFLLFLAPVVNLVFHIMVSLELAKRFGRPPLVAVGLIFFPAIFYAVLGFDSSVYTPPSGPYRSDNRSG
jgi:hypothetical protein